MIPFNSTFVVFSALSATGTSTQGTEGFRKGKIGRDIRGRPDFTFHIVMLTVFDLRLFTVFAFHSGYHRFLLPELN